MANIEEVRAVLAEYGLAAVREPAPVGIGTLNWNWRIETDAGPHFLRRHRPDVTKERIQEEHALLTWVEERGIPAVPPATTKDGASVVVHADALWALFPWIEGAPPTRGSLTVPQARAAGGVHGRIVQVLAEHPVQGTLPSRYAHDTPASAATLERVIAAAVSQRAGTWILDGLRQQLALLDEHAKETPTFDGMTTGLSHGDYHDQQLLFNKQGSVVAVTDWEMFGLRHLVLEVIRSLWFSQLMEQPAMDAYVDGYREHVRLAEAECRLGMELWWHGRLHATWVYEALYIEGNTRVAELLPETFRVLQVLADRDARETLTGRFVRAATG